MSTLQPKDKSVFERLFNMKSGYVSSFNDATMGTFFGDFNIDISGSDYIRNGGSKANKLRAFWAHDNDQIVGLVMQAMVEREETNHPPGPSNDKRHLIEEGKNIATCLQSGSINLNHIKANAVESNANYLKEQITRMEMSIDTDPALAIGTAKELIETCCKTILTERGKPMKGTQDIPTLTKATLKELKLLPNDVPDAVRGKDVIKRLLQNLGTIGNNLAELRGLYGTGHGKDGQTTGLETRHAKLAVGSATTLATFLFETHKSKSE